MIAREITGTSIDLLEKKRSGSLDLHSRNNLNTALCNKVCGSPSLDDCTRILNNGEDQICVGTTPNVQHSGSCEFTFVNTPSSKSQKCISGEDFKEVASQLLHACMGKKGIGDCYSFSDDSSICIFDVNLLCEVGFTDG